MQRGVAGAEKQLHSHPGHSCRTQGGPGSAPAEPQLPRRAALLTVLRSQKVAPRRIQSIPRDVGVGGEPGCSTHSCYWPRGVSDLSRVTQLVSGSRDGT